MGDLGRFIEAGEQQSAVIGFFAVDEENGIIGRNDTKSNYGVFREASTKNKDASFGIVKDKALAVKCGIPRLPMVLTFHYDEDGKQYEIRKTQFFEDMAIYYSDDKPRRVGLLKKGETEEDFKFVSLAPKRPGKKAAGEPQVWAVPADNTQHPAPS